MKNVASRIAYLRKDVARLSQAEFGRKIGVSRGAVANWEVGGDISRENISNIASMFNVSLDWLDKGRGAPPDAHPMQSHHTPVAFSSDREQSLMKGTAEQANAYIDRDRLSSWRKIPVYGQAVAGVNGEFVMNGNVLFDAFAPINITDVSNAYGVRVAGESMWPRYEDGEIVFVDTTKTPRKGDYVVVQVHTGQDDEAPWAYVKRFLRHNSSELVLSQFNPEKELTFPHDQVVSVHVIVMAGQT
jgi:phage repressor protein C with HTH and peptisase S24 domain